MIGETTIYIGCLLEASSAAPRGNAVNDFPPGKYSVFRYFELAPQ
jgi:hypothetical protein